MRSLASKEVRFVKNLTSIRALDDTFASARHPGMTPCPAPCTRIKRPHLSVVQLLKSGTANSVLLHARYRSLRTACFVSAAVSAAEKRDYEEDFSACQASVFPTYSLPGFDRHPALRPEPPSPRFAPSLETPPVTAPSTTRNNRWPEAPKNDRHYDRAFKAPPSSLPCNPGSPGAPPGGNANQPPSQKL